MNTLKAPFYLTYTGGPRGERSLDIRWECVGYVNQTAPQLPYDPAKTFIGQAPLKVTFRTEEFVPTTSRFDLNWTCLDGFDSVEPRFNV